VERPPTVPLLLLAALHASSDGGGAHEVSPPLAGVRGAGGRGGVPRSGGGDSASERTGHVPTRPGSRSGLRGA
jgi:hypothetical protein